MSSALEDWLMKPSFQMYQQMKKNTNGKINPMKCSVLKKCEWCGNLYTPTHHSQKYCTTECYRNHRREYKAKWKRENDDRIKETLGTTGISSHHRNKNFKTEAKIIRNERKRTGI